MADVCFPVRGGRDAAIAAAMTPVLVGFNSETNPPNIPNIEWEFIDWPFTKQFDTRAELNSTIRRHLSLVEAHKPKVAVAPDIQEGVDVDRALSVAEELDQYAENVVIVPKTGDFSPQDVPTQFRVGVPNRADVRIPFINQDYRQARSLHILGGSLTSQLKRRDSLPNIDSVDSSQAVFAAFNDKTYWDGRRFRQVNNAGDIGFSLLVLSLRNYAYTWGMTRGPQFRTGSFREEEPLPEVMERRDPPGQARLPGADDLRRLVEQFVPGGEVLDFNEDFPVVIEMGGTPAQMEEADLFDLTDALGEIYDYEFQSVRGANIIRVEGVRDDWTADTAPADDSFVTLEDGTNQSLFDF